MLAEKHDYGAAIEHSEKQLAFNSDLGGAHFILGGAPVEKGDFPAAITNFREAIRLAPEWSEAYFRLGRALLEAGRGDEAMAES